MNIRYREGSLPHNFTKSYKKSFQCLSFKVQVPLPLKKVIQNATKKIEFMEREKHIYKRKWIKKVRRHQNIFI